MSESDEDDDGVTANKCEGDSDKQSLDDSQDTEDDVTQSDSAGDVTTPDEVIGIPESGSDIQMGNGSGESVAQPPKDPTPVTSPCGHGSTVPPLMGPTEVDRCSIASKASRSGGLSRHPPNAREAQASVGQHNGQTSTVTVVTPPVAVQAENESRGHENQNKPGNNSNSKLPNQPGKNSNLLDSGATGNRSSVPNTLSSDLRNMRQFPLFDSPVNRPSSIMSKPSAPSAAPPNPRVPANGNAVKQGYRAPNVPSAQTNARSNSGAVTSNPGPRTQQANANRNMGNVDTANGAARGTLQTKQTNTQPFANGTTARPAAPTRAANNSIPSIPRYGSGDLPNQSWADDLVADAEIIAHMDASDRYATAGQGGDIPETGPQSKMSIFRDVFNDTMQKDTRSRQEYSPSFNGDKRGPADVIELDDSQGNVLSYAEMAGEGDWTDYHNKRMKHGASGDHIPLLFGIRPELHHDIFVRHLNYSTCRKPEDLELLVKSTAAETTSRSTFRALTVG